MADDRKVVMLALLGSFSIVVADQALVKDQAPKPRIIGGLTIAFIMLGFLTEIAPKVAKYFAVLVFVAVTLEQGPAVWKAGSSALGGKAKAVKRPPKKTKKAVKK